MAKTNFNDSARQAKRTTDAKARPVSEEVKIQILPTFGVTFYGSQQAFIEGDFLPDGLVWPTESEVLDFTFRGFRHRLYRAAPGAYYGNWICILCASKKTKEIDIKHMDGTYEREQAKAFASKSGPQIKVAKNDKRFQSFVALVQVTA